VEHLNSGESRQALENIRRVLEPPFPARSAFGAAGLALGGRVEIECVAACDPSP